MFNKKRQNIEENLLAETEQALFFLYEVICEDVERYDACIAEDGQFFLYQILCEDLEKYNQYLRELPNTKEGNIYREAYQSRLNEVLKLYHLEEAI